MASSLGLIVCAGLLSFPGVYSPGAGTPLGALSGHLPPLPLFVLGPKLSVAEKSVGLRLLRHSPACFRHHGPPEGRWGGGAPPGICP